MKSYYFLTIVGNNADLFEAVLYVWENVKRDILSFDKNSYMFYVIADNHIHALIKTEFKLTAEYLLKIMPKHISFTLKKIKIEDKIKVRRYITNHDGKHFKIRSRQ